MLISLRSFSRPCSGRMAPVPHSGLSITPRRIASEDLAAARASSVRAVLSMEHDKRTAEVDNHDLGADNDVNDGDEEVIAEETSKDVKLVAKLSVVN